jgi:AAA+ ATPase superfamily predicted ATPase
VEEKELYVMNHIGGSSEGSKRDNTNNLLGHLYCVETKEFLEELQKNGREKELDFTPMWIEKEIKDRYKPFNLSSNTQKDCDAHPK